MDYLTRVELIAINEHMGAMNSSTIGTRDDGALEAALLRPQMTHYSDIIQKTASLMEAVVLGEPFLSHNQRTAVAAADVFLRMNGSCISVEPTDGYNFLNARYFRKEFTIDVMINWLRENTAQVTI